MSIVANAVRAFRYLLSDGAEHDTAVDIVTHTHALNSAQIEELECCAECCCFMCLDKENA